MGMRGPVVFIGRGDSPLLAHLQTVEPDLLVLGPSDPLTPAYVLEQRPRMVVSHGYRIILRADVLGLLPERIVNAHISLLPWNRGADPVLWAAIDGTPPGVTLHHMDEGVDTGPVIAQSGVPFEPGDTLATAYARCTDRIGAVFADLWPLIDQGATGCQEQGRLGGSHHFVSDRALVEHLLTDGWDTPVAALSRA